MLTVKEINEISFGKAGFSGYKPEDVDRFIDQVAASFQELLGERDAAMKQASDLAALNSELAAKNADSQRKLSILAQKVEAYRQEEEGIKEAILSAQRMSKDLVKEAQTKSDAILQDSRAQAEAKLLEANEEARRITYHAEEDAAKAAKEYAQQVEAKKTELEEVKRQVTAFRSSLLEMYKKHLECIDHIPVFRQKEDRSAKPAPSPKPEPGREPDPPVQNVRPELVEEGESVQEVQAQEPVAPAPAVRQPVSETISEPDPVTSVRMPEPPQQHQASAPGSTRERNASASPPEVYQEASARPTVSRNVPHTDHPRYQEPARRTLNDRVNYVQEQLQPSAPPESYLGENDLSSVGIDLNAHSNIPEALRREKSNHYSNLPFGDGVEIDDRKRRR
ncbi:DivIVA domain-containing protein [Acutalibacter sp. 1XD8-33]|uniref:DivIVA domain-containing protein n=1 Tax=Acutalibacter sp. 1XD8-33 TaxID=2320081 RepID=UPI000EA3BA0F|nr:DivIVA domain-containing protein [Acutalibacter sp. 1XD8-33]RKJ40406.1 DivIVA domain-containing protein [Acutalibacter sp. 1XD8-33]